MMNILEQIKEECEKHNDCEESCKLYEDSHSALTRRCLLNHFPSTLNIAEIEKRLSAKLNCTLDCSNCTDKPKCDRRDDEQTET